MAIYKNSSLSSNNVFYATTETEPSREVHCDGANPCTSPDASEPTLKIPSSIIGLFYLVTRNEVYNSCERQFWLIQMKKSHSEYRKWAYHQINTLSRHHSFSKMYIAIMTSINKYTKHSVRLQTLKQQIRDINVQNIVQREDLVVSKEDRKRLISYKRDKKYAAQSLFGIDLNVKHPPEMSQFVNNLNSWMEGLQNMFNGELKNFHWLRKLALMAFILWRSDDKYIRIALLTDFAVEIGVVEFDMIAYAPILVKVIERLQSNKPQAQSFFDEHPENLVMLIAKVLLLVFGINNASKISFNEHTIKNIRNIWSLVQSVQGIFQFCEKSLDYIKDYVTSVMTGIPVEAIQLDKMIPGYKRWFDRATTVILNDGNFEVLRDLKVADEVLKLIEEGDEMLKRFMILRVNQNLQRIFLLKYGQLVKMRDAAHALKRFDKPRTPPFCLYLYGDSNVGKSTLTPVIYKTMMAYEGIYDEDIAHIHMPTNNFWDSYRNQPVVVMDDVFQSTEVLHLIQETMDIIHMCNNMTFPLHMADLKEKGQVKFDSRLIVLTSNQGTPVETGVTCQEAVLRRRDLVVNVRLRAELCESYKYNGKLRIRLKEVPHDLDTSIYEFDLYNGIQDKCYGKGLNFDEFMSKFKELYYGKRERDERILKQINEKSHVIKAQSWFSNNEEENRIMEMIEMPRCLQNFEGLFEPFMEQMFEYMVVHPEEVDLMKLSPDKLLQFELWKINRGTIQKAKHDCMLWYNVLTATVDVYKKKLESSKYFPSINKVFVSLGVVISGFGLYSYFSAGTKSENISGDQVTIKHRNLRSKMRKPKINPKPLRLKAEACSDQNGIDLICNKFSYNVVRFRLDVNMSGKGQFVESHGFIIKDRIMLIPAHDLLIMPDGETYISLYTIAGSWEKFRFDELDILDLEDIDCIAVKLPNFFPQFRDVSQHFILEEDLRKYDFSHLRIITTSRSGSRVNIREESFRKCRILKTPRYFQKDESIDIVRGFEYIGETHAGMCGSPLVMMNKFAKRKLVGFHVAGTQSYGISNIITQDTLKLIFDHFDTTTVNLDLTLLDEPVAQSYISQDDVVEKIGCVSSTDGVFHPSKSSIAPSPIFDMIKPHTTKPAMLKRVGDIDPFRNGLVKYFGGNQLMDEHILDQIVDDIIFEQSCCDSHVQRVLTDHEALNGIIDNEYIRPVNLDTSPGYPWVLRKSSEKGKRAFVYVDTDHQIYPKPDLKQALDKRERDLNNNTVTSTIWQDNLKDERRPLEKVELGKTRVFMSAPVDFIVTFRKYFLSYCAFCMENRRNLECAVGVNPHSMEEWTDLYNYLISVDEDHTFIAGDFSCYDGSITAQLIYAVCRIVNAWYGDEFYRHRELLFSSVCFPYHIVGRTVYRVYRGNPSGNPLTTILNSMINTILIRYAWIKIAEPHNLGLSDYYRFVRAKNYGDDNILCVSNQCPWFTIESIGAILSTVGMKYTPADKLGGDITKITFLKRGFRWDQFALGYNAPIEQNTIYEILNWIRIGGLSNLDALEANIDDALREAVHHGREFYVSLWLEIRGALSRIGHFMALPQYNEMRIRIRDDPHVGLYSSG